MTIYDEYFEWIYQLVEGKGYRCLLTHIYNTNFYPVIPMDDNRIMDGCELRYKFADECNYPASVIDVKFDSNSCNILEMMVGLAMRVENSIMSDSDFGDRTTMWFWMMIKSLGLYHMNDIRYDDFEVDDILTRFLNREYEPNGAGGLFTVNDSPKDMRDIEIWYQMCLFFDNLL